MGQRQSKLLTEKFPMDPFETLSANNSLGLAATVVQKRLREALTELHVERLLIAD